MAWIVNENRGYIHTVHVYSSFLFILHFVFIMYGLTATTNFDRKWKKLYEHYLDLWTFCFSQFLILFPSLSSRRHTLAFISSRGRLYAFGLGGSGQLGTKTDKNSLVPVVVRGPWAPPANAPPSSSASTADGTDPPKPGAASTEPDPFFFRSVFGGGDQSFVVVSSQEVSLVPVVFTSLFPYRCFSLRLRLQGGLNLAVRTASSSSNSSL
jgi:hypothetical protein